MSKTTVEPLNNKSPLLYIIVIGFHHKKGCVVEFVYPSDNHIQKIDDLDPSSDLYRLPKNWKHLPSLALPDGSHNYESDYVYFHLEDHDVEINETEKKPNTKKLKANKTIFGVSCYRQINASELINKDSDVTRNTMQKSVCILSKLPLYSNIRIKLASITSAYFEQKDFHKTDLLVNSFNSLSKSYETLYKPNPVTRSIDLNNEKSQYLVGLTLGDLVLRYQHKILVLFKLLLLQKKCLFQIKPVSNLSNTIMSLVSLIPDIFLPPSNEDKDSLLYCSGFFDSIDLVNCELERKDFNSKKKPQVSPLSESILFNHQSSQSSSELINNSNNKHRKKLRKKKGMSFSKKNSNHQNSSALSTSLSTVSLKTPGSASITKANIEHDFEKASKKNHNNPTITVSASAFNINESKKNSNNNKKESRLSFLNTFSSNTQKLFSFNNGNMNNHKNDQDDSMNHAIDDHDNEGSFVKSKLDIKLSNSSNSINEDGNNKSRSDAQDLHQNQLGNTIKSRVSNIFKFVDWNSTSQSSNESTSTPKQSTSKKQLLKEQLLKSSQSTHANGLVLDNSVLGETTEINSGSYENNKQTSNNYDIEISELLDLDFGMPFNTFNEFNILHPYLSLYYLEYFSMINKMNTKLFCTTALMMNMMKQDKTTNSNEEEESASIESNDQSQSKPPTQYKPYSPLNSSTANSHQNPFGYTIGATNVLFKQRLYDDLDAFIDETEIDLKNNETLKKQLQLSTADLRFADYIIKNVNASKASNETVNNYNNNKNNNQNTPTLLSFKKISSSTNINKPNKNLNDTSVNDSDTSDDSANNLSSVWEGSDDWIRLNFKWYLYAMLGSIIKEDLYNIIKNELDHIYFNSTNNSEHSSNGNNFSSSSSSVSLANEVVDIDDYIEKVNSNKDINEQSINSLQINDKNQRGSKNYNKESNEDSRKNSNTSSTSTLSSSKYYLMQANTQSDYRDDFNSQYINELKKTSLYKNWYELNRSKIEKDLLKFDLKKLESQLAQQSQSLNSTSASSNDLVNINNKFQLLLNQLQELEKIKLNHPFNGQIGVNDIKLRLNVLFTTTESGRKLNKALIEGGKFVNNTGKAVGDALSQAKSTFNSFLSNWSTSNNNNSSTSSATTPLSSPNASIFVNKSSKTLSDDFNTSTTATTNM